MIKKIAVVLLLVIVAGCSGPEGFDELKKEGVTTYLRGDYVKSKEYLSKAVLINHSDRDVLYYLGLCFQQEYILDSALYYFKRADILHPDDRDINMAIYHSAVELKEWEYTINAITVLIHTGDPKEKYYDQLSDLNLRIDRPYVAMLYARHHLNDNPEDPKRYIKLANLASQIDSTEYAIEILDQAIEKFGDKTEYVINRAINISKLGRHSEAEKIMRSQLSSNPDNEIIKYNFANVLTAQDDKKKKMEGYNLYKEVRESAGNIYNIDSTITALESELKIK